MIKGKWLKAGAAAFMSAMILTGCGNSDEPQMEQENQVPGEEQEGNGGSESISEDEPGESNEKTETDED
ncbi:hypothetical protein [Planomicrobium sp. Y74]|uniref:hypothetical protein n=1 Tax=Planomicrobium sp. Y74 TaxID=2478977 RepID=UPI000EF5294A|nr:hypothetical protein [Planomicrobium sp. Y74]RLQ90118.1 hypothetical protein D9754_10290 [Planomicrobium sp. Y74]